MNDIKTGDIAIMCISDRHAAAEMMELKLGSTFQLENLPKGFMGQAMEDRLALLSALRKR